MSDSGKPSASQSQRGSREPPRLYSYLDDQSVCHDHHSEMQPNALNGSTSTGSLSSKEDVEKELGKKSRSSGDSQERQDLEQGPVEKSHTPKSIQDPNIISSPPDLWHIGLQCPHYYTLLTDW